MLVTLRVRLIKMIQGVGHWLYLDWSIKLMMITCILIQFGSNNKLIIGPAAFIMGGLFCILLMKHDLRKALRYKCHGSFKRCLMCE
jgi:hypothetical protein